MEGAASAANSRSTSHTPSRAQSPDLPFSQHAHDESPEASSQHKSHLLVPSSSELQVGHSTPMQQQLPAADDAADSDFSQAASQPGSSHSSPAVSKQRPVSPSVNRAAAVQASLTLVNTTAAALLSPGPEASVAESKQTNDLPVQQNPDSDAMLSQQPHDFLSSEKAMKGTSSSSGDMLRQSRGLEHSEHSRELSPAIQPMQPASSMAGPETALCPHEVSEARSLPWSLNLHHSASLSSNNSQSSCGNEHSLQPETAPQAPAGREASCKSDSAQSSVDSVSDTAAELRTDTVAIPAVPSRDILQLGSGLASSNSSCRHSLDGKALPRRSHDSAGTSLCSQAPVSTSITAEDSRSTLHSSTSPTAASSSAAVVEADTVLSSVPVQLCLPSDARQAEADPLQHTPAHAMELESPLSQKHASQSATSQSGSSKHMSYQTEQSKRGQRGASPQGGSSASSHMGLLAADQPDQPETHDSSSLQVCKHERQKDIKAETQERQESFHRY